MKRILGAMAMAMVLITMSAIPAFANSNADIKRMIALEAAKTDVPASLAMAIAKVGADFRPDHKGLKGARGVMQILPDTAEGMGVTPAALWQPRRNIRLGLEILSHLLKRTEGDWAEAVAAYHSDMFSIGDNGSRKRVAQVLKWERRFAEQLALQDPIQSRRRDVLAGGDLGRDQSRDLGRDDWRNETATLDAPDIFASDEFPRDEPPYEPPLLDEPWMTDGNNETVEIIIIERPQEHLEERPTIFNAPPPPPPHWLDRGEPRWRHHRRSRNARPLRRMMRQLARRNSRQHRRHAW
jgi:hypothetical protein